MIPGLCSLLYPGRGSSSPSFSAIISPAYVAGGTSIGTANTGPATAVALGGVAPFTYAWSYTTGDPSISISAPTSVITHFTSILAAGDDKIATFTCLITDTHGATGSAIVTAELVSTD